MTKQKRLSESIQLLHKEALPAKIGVRYGNPMASLRLCQHSQGD